MKRTAPSTSSAAASPARRPRGRSRATTSASFCMRCARSGKRPYIARATSPNLSAPIHFAPTTRTPAPSACCIGRCARFDSLIMSAADAHKLPAGGALAVDRGAFAAHVTAAVAAHPMIEIRREEIEGLPPADWTNIIIATGPLTSPKLAAAIAALTGERDLAFFDAIAPVVHRDSIDMDKAWMQSRYDKAGPGGTGADYINCPLTQGPILRLYRRHQRRREDRIQGIRGYALFQRLPADRNHGRARPETLRHGPMKPFGLTNPHTPGRQTLRGGAAAAG